MMGGVQIIQMGGLSMHVFGTSTTQEQEGGEGNMKWNLRGTKNMRIANVVHFTLCPKERVFLSENVNLSLS